MSQDAPGAYPDCFGCHYSSGSPWCPGAAPEFTVTLLAEGDSTFHTPLDATPDPDGEVVYFVARASGGEAGVFRVLAGGGEVESLLVGAPLVATRGIKVLLSGLLNEADERLRLARA